MAGSSFKEAYAKRFGDKNAAKVEDAAKAKEIAKKNIKAKRY